jgi:hypothetical protein
MNVMDRLTLAHLEQAIEPYRRAGFVVTSQSETAINLALPKERFSYLLFVVLLLVWPLAVLYFISYSTQRERSVCLRYTSQGYIEVSGYTLEAIARGRRRRKFTYLVLLVVIAVVILLILLWAYLPRMH